VRSQESQSTTLRHIRMRILPRHLPFGSRPVLIGAVSIRTGHPLRSWSISIGSCCAFATKLLM
jgi:hypothetical protein